MNLSNESKRSQGQSARTPLISLLAARLSALGLTLSALTLVGCAPVSTHPDPTAGSPSTIVGSTSPSATPGLTRTPAATPVPTPAPQQTTDPSSPFPQVPPQSLPSTFPAEVPVLDARILYASASTSKHNSTWQVDYLPAGDVDTVFSSITAQFEAAGYEFTDFTGQRFFSFGGTAFTIVGGRAAGFEKGNFTVVVTVGLDPDDVLSADYSVNQNLG